MTNLPSVQGQAPEPDEPVDAGLSDYLRASNIVEAINANLPDGAPQLTPIPKDYIFRKRDRETVSVAMHAAFELIGGVPAFIQWGSKNPKDFYLLWSKLLPSQTETPIGGTTIQFISAIPSNPLDAVTIDATGRVIDSPYELPE